MRCRRPSSIPLVVTFILLEIVDATRGLRVGEDEEVMGLDLSQHGERAYSL